MAAGNMHKDLVKFGGGRSEMFSLSLTFVSRRVSVTADSVLCKQRNESAFSNLEASTERVLGTFVTSLPRCRCCGCNICENTSCSAAEAHYTA